MMLDRAAFVAAAAACADTPFVHQGRLPGVGLDCAGLVVCALAAVGYPVEDVPAYGRIPFRGQFKAMVEKHCDPIAFADLADGDLCMFRFQTDPQHIGIYAGGQLIHCWSDAGRVVVHNFDADWRDRLTGCYRLRAD